jgi:phage terminase small subunit
MLTNKTRLYAQHRLAGLNQTDAAIAAGYSAATATPAASRLEKNKNYIDHMARLMAKLQHPTDGAPIAKVAKEKKVKKPTEPKRVEVKQPTPAATFQPVDVVFKPLQPALKIDMDIDGLPAPLAHMLDLMNNQNEDPKLRLDAAKALASFTVAKPGDVGKKDQQAKVAKEAASGKFAAAAPPKLVSAGGRKV